MRKVLGSGSAPQESKPPQLPGAGSPSVVRASLLSPRTCLPYIPSKHWALLSPRCILYFPPFFFWCFETVSALTPLPPPLSPRLASNSGSSSCLRSPGCRHHRNTHHPVGLALDFPVNHSRVIACPGARETWLQTFPSSVSAPPKLLVVSEDTMCGALQDICPTSIGWAAPQQKEKGRSFRGVDPRVSSLSREFLRKRSPRLLNIHLSPGCER